MANKLKELSVTSVDLVDQGANPDAHICLFKRGEREPEEGLFRKFLAWFKKECPEEMDNGASGNSPGGIAKEAQSFADNISQERLREVTSQMYDCCYALSDSFSSILCDKELGAEEKENLFLTSLDEFAAAVRAAAANWAAGKKMQDEEADVQKSTAQQKAFQKFFQKYEKSIVEPAKPEDLKIPISETEETDTMKIDKSKMTPEEQAIFAEFEKKYGVADGESGGAVPGAEPPAAGDGVAKAAEPAAASAQTGEAAELHPEVKKALADLQELAKRRDAEVEELKKSLEIERLTAAAKKYEVLGKSAGELAEKLYNLKKAGGTVYEDYVALLDENVNTLTKSGLFREIGKNRSGSAGTEQTLGIKAAELAKSAAGDMSTPDAIIKAWEENQELAAQYEAEYINRR